MKIGVIKKLAENESIESLKKAEENILNEESLDIEVEGEDEGEKLTHVSGALWVKEQMEKEGLSVKDGIRAYSQRIRGSLN